MVSLDDIQNFMKKKVAEDREVKSVSVSGESLDAALKSASLELGVPVLRVEYDIIQKGSSGFLGMGKKGWSLIAYPLAKKIKVKVGPSAEGLTMEGISQEDTQPKDRDGRAFVRLWADGVYVKVEKPIGRGHEIEEDEVNALLQDRAVHEVNHQALKGTVKLATGNYQKVGEFIHNSAADASVTAYLDDSDMQALIFANAPGPGGADLSMEELEHFMRNFGIVHGINDERLEAFIDTPKYNEKYLVAEGSKPVNGKDARLLYNFEIKKTYKPNETEGKVDFKSLNSIHNVVKGEEVAIKEPAEKGLAGRTVTGRMLPAKDGKDANFELSNGVYLSKDGLKVLAAVDGQVILSGGKIVVETVLTIPGNVNLASGGNISVLGSVIVKGEVEDGFSIQAGGNIEVMGSVGRDCMIETPGDVILHGGINGGEKGFIKSGGSVWSRFIQHARVTSQGFVIVSDGIMNSDVDAEKKVLCKGRKAKIIGGHIRAGDEINAASFGGNGTTLEVGYDPKIKEELDDLVEKREVLVKSKEEKDLNLAGLMKILRVRKNLPPEKEKVLLETRNQIQELTEQISSMTEEIDAKTQYLASFETKGRIAASGEIQAGVKIIIRGVEFEANRDYRGVSFALDNNLIRTQKYEAFDEEEISRKN